MGQNNERLLIKHLKTQLYTPLHLLIPNTFKTVSLDLQGEQIRNSLTDSGLFLPREGLLSGSGLSYSCVHQPASFHRAQNKENSSQSTK